MRHRQAVPPAHRSHFVSLNDKGLMVRKKEFLHSQELVAGP